mmetsp:Transcript_30237/g.44992  ORF Transcript_30237/g.44992 Transcript_30237/m.44992 type:complete len:97 (-) Transcript_30237:375-665(-)
MRHPSNQQLQSCMVSARRECSKVYVVDYQSTELRTKATGNDDNMQRSNWSPSGHLSFSIIDKPQKLYSWGGRPVAGSLHFACGIFTLFIIQRMEAV